MRASVLPPTAPRSNATHGSLSVLAAKTEETIDLEQEPQFAAIEGTFKRCLNASAGSKAEKNVKTTCTRPTTSILIGVRETRVYASLTIGINSTS